MARFVALVLLLWAPACSDEPRDARALPGDGTSRVAERDGTHANDAAAIADDAPLVAFLGDSLAAGLHLPADAAFPAVLQRELAADGVPMRLINAGVSGDTTAGGLRRIDWVLSRSPDIVVVELGANDGLRGRDVSSIESNLRAIVARIKDSGARVLLLGMDVPPSLGLDYASDFAAMYERVAEAEEVPLVERFLRGVGGVRALNLEDGMHPTAEGHRKLAENVEEALRELLEAEE
jgi:acyl-CoA thioesterase-1